MSDRYFLMVLAACLGEFALLAWLLVRRVMGYE